MKSLETYFTEPFASRPASSVAKVLSSERGVGGGLGPPPSSPPRPSVDRVSGGQMSSASGGSPAPAQPSPLSKKRQQHPTFEQWMVTNRDKAKVLVDQVHTYYYHTFTVTPQCVYQDLEMKYVLLRSNDDYCFIHFCTITIVKMQQHESILFLFVTWPLHQVTNFGPSVTN